MILANRAVILHMPKTGGVFIRMLLEKYYGDDVRLANGADFRDPSAPTAQHHSLADAPASAHGLPIFGAVRNPWDWYVSWYHFFMSYPYRPPHFITVSEDKTLDFGDFIRNLHNYPEDSAEYLANSFSPEYHRIFGTTPEEPVNPSIRVGRYETIHDDVEAFFAEIGLEQACVDEVATFRSMNPSRHDPYWTYYTEDLAELVYGRDGAVIDAFGYELRARPSRGS